MRSPQLPIAFACATCYVNFIVCMYYRPIYNSKNLQRHISEFSKRTIDIFYRCIDECFLVQMFSADEWVARVSAVSSRAAQTAEAMRHVPRTEISTRVFRRRQAATHRSAVSSTTRGKRVKCFLYINWPYSQRLCKRPKPVSLSDLFLTWSAPKTILLVRYLHVSAYSMEASRLDVGQKPENLQG